MANSYTNKIIINGVTRIDLTSDTVSPSNLMEGIIAHDASGASIVGEVQIYDGSVT